mmetsp:Transcript_78418/g.239881  ORF Transcript_78418/g.239881 Transcript_78418/m.239881 type:complete len:239 (-) Transcript_78418:1236-1952(-)
MGCGGVRGCDSCPLCHAFASLALAQPLWPEGVNKGRADHDVGRPPRHGRPRPRNPGGQESRERHAQPHGRGAGALPRRRRRGVDFGGERHHRAEVVRVPGRQRHPRGPHGARRQGSQERRGPRQQRVAEALGGPRVVAVVHAHDDYRLRAGPAREGAEPLPGGRLGQQLGEPLPDAAARRLAQTAGDAPRRLAEGEGPGTVGDAGDPAQPADDPDGVRADHQQHHQPHSRHPGRGARW